MIGCAIAIALLAFPVQSNSRLRSPDDSGTLADELVDHVVQRALIKLQCYHLQGANLDHAVLAKPESFVNKHSERFKQTWRPDFFSHKGTTWQMGHGSWRFGHAKHAWAGHSKMAGMRGRTPAGSMKPNNIHYLQCTRPGEKIPHTRFSKFLSQRYRHTGGFREPEERTAKEFAMDKIVGVNNEFVTDTAETKYGGTANRYGYKKMRRGVWIDVTHARGSMPRSYRTGHHGQKLYSSNMNIVKGAQGELPSYAIKGNKGDGMIWGKDGGFAHEVYYKKEYNMGIHPIIEPKGVDKYPWEQKLFIKGLPMDTKPENQVDWKELTVHMRKAGKVKYAAVGREHPVKEWWTGDYNYFDPRYVVPTGSGHVAYETKEEAQKALKELNNTEIKGHKITVHAWDPWRNFNYTRYAHNGEVIEGKKYSYWPIEEERPIFVPNVSDTSLQWHNRTKTSDWWAHGGKNGGQVQQWDRIEKDWLPKYKQGPQTVDHPYKKTRDGKKIRVKPQIQMQEYIKYNMIDAHPETLTASPSEERRATEEMARFETLKKEHYGQVRMHKKNVLELLKMSAFDRENPGQEGVELPEQVNNIDVLREASKLRNAVKWGIHTSGLFGGSLIATSENVRENYPDIGTYAWGRPEYPPDWMPPDPPTESPELNMGWPPKHVDETWTKEWRAEHEPKKSPEEWKAGQFGIGLLKKVPGHYGDYYG